MTSEAVDQTGEAKPAGAQTRPRDHLVRKLFRGEDPFAGFPFNPKNVDIQGWSGSRHAMLADLIRTKRPRIVVEVGTWKGASVIFMADLMRQEKIDGVIIAVDTWLGSHEHWVQAKWFGGLKMQRGRPTVFRTFMNNVISEGVQDYVLPLSLDSVNASLVLRQMKIAPDILHLDAGHDYESVARDLAVWWPLLPPGAVLIGDDYHHDGPLWPGVKQAFNELTDRENLPFQFKTPKITVVKPTPST